MNNTIARKRAPIPCAYDADKWGGGVYVADVGIDPRELSPAPVEWSHTWSSVYVQTLTLLPYSVQCICTDPDAVPIPCACIADKWGGGVCGRCGSQHPGAIGSCTRMNSNIDLCECTNPSAVPIPCMHCRQVGRQFMWQMWESAPGSSLQLRWSQPKPLPD